MNSSPTKQRVEQRFNSVAARIDAAAADYNYELRMRRWMRVLAVFGVALLGFVMAIAMGILVATVPPGRLFVPTVIAGVVLWGGWGLRFLTLRH